MLTTFSYDKEREYDRIFYIFHNIVIGLYQKNGFYVLPEQLHKDPQSIYLPRLKGFNHHKYLNTFRLQADNVPLERKGNVLKVIDEMKRSEFKPEPVNRAVIKKIESKWSMISALFEDSIYDLLPEYAKYSFKVEIGLSHYGSLVSYFAHKLDNKTINIQLYLRDDMGTSQIAEGILTSLITSHNNFLKYSFIQRETITDFLFEHTKLARIFPDYHPTLNKLNTRNKDKNYIASLEYLNELGFSSDRGLTLHKNTILINNQNPRYPFTRTEEKLIRKFISFPNETISYYDLGDIIWKNDPDKFSLWALSRIISRIRHKLYMNNLSPDLIKTIRDKGYCFYPQILH